MYAWLMSLRNYLFTKQIIKSYELHIPVISIGNISVGGTGKTPHVDLLLKQLVKKYKPAVVSRAYKAQAQSIQKVDLNKKSAALYYGDEPCLLQQKNPEAKVFVGPQKYQTAQWVEKNYQDVNVLVVDDGFQHRKLKRNLDIVLLDTSVPKEHYRLLPWGRLREDLVSLQRADVIILTKTEMASKETLKFLLEKIPSDKMIFKSWIEASKFVFQSVKKEWMEVKQLNAKKAFYFCALAQPQSFIELMQKDYGMEVVGGKAFPDHYAYQEEDLQHIQQAFSQSRADILMTTEKDFIKLPAHFSCWVVPIKIKLDREEKFYEIIDMAITNYRLASGEATSKRP